jgi:hypothetical protein
MAGLVPISMLLPARRPPDPGTLVANLLHSIPAASRTASASAAMSPMRQPAGAVIDKGSVRARAAGSAGRPTAGEASGSEAASAAAWPVAATTDTSDSNR